MGEKESANCARAEREWNEIPPYKKNFFLFFFIFKLARDVGDNLQLSIFLYRKKGCLRKGGGEKVFEKGAVRKGGKKRWLR